MPFNSEASSGLRAHTRALTPLDVDFAKWPALRVIMEIIYVSGPVISRSEIPYSHAKRA